MLSSALRHGTLKHLLPHAQHVTALAGIQGTEERIGADVGLLVATEADRTLARVPVLSDIW